MNGTRASQRRALFACCACVLVACVGPRATTDGATTGARREVLAPIEAAEVIVRESFPPQYALEVTSGLPSGCAAFARIDVKRAGAAFEVSVWNSVPADPTTACTMIYGTRESSVELGSDLEAGRAYEVRINGASRTVFVAQ